MNAISLPTQMSLNNRSIEFSASYDDVDSYSVHILVDGVQSAYLSLKMEADTEKFHFVYGSPSTQYKDGKWVEGPMNLFNLCIENAPKLSEDEFKEIVSFLTRECKVVEKDWGGYAPPSDNLVPLPYGEKPHGASLEDMVFAAKMQQAEAGIFRPITHMDILGDDYDEI